MDQTFDRIERIVTGENGLQWLQLLCRLRDSPSVAVDKELTAELVALEMGRIAPNGIALTDFGRKCADSAREYIFWLERNRKFHCEDQYRCTRLENFQGKDILELGSGWGCNLIRLSSVAKMAIGIEIEPVYTAFSRVLAKREGLSPPHLILGSAEAAPFRAMEFDWVVVWSALQYMDVSKVLHECSRVLRPGGYALVSYSWLGPSICFGFRRAIRERHPRILGSLASMIVNTLWYQVFGARIRKNVREAATARPIYVTKRYMAKLGKRAGLLVRTDLGARTGDDRSIIVFEKNIAPK